MHEAYIAEAIKGVLMQQCGFDVELIIADDCSPDKTSNVVESFKGNPNYHWIKYTRHIKNIGWRKNFVWALQQAKAKYTAFCEGDDIWTDPLKLKQQVEFLLKNDEFGLVCSNWRNIDADGKWINDKSLNISSGQVGNSDFFNPYRTKTATVIYETDLIKNLDFKKFLYFKDITLFAYLLNKKKGFYFEDVFCNYRLQPVGVWSNTTKREKTIINFNSVVEIYYFIEKNKHFTLFLLNSLKNNRIMFDLSRGSLRNIKFILAKHIPRILLKKLRLIS
jgi:glycosyltransferase involved in cell wall biosynthesis